MTPNNAVRCAIYTRKSSDEGLEQSFNSLDAQREACLAYVSIQNEQRWKAIETQYDDGGYTGGSLERPALKQLLRDVEMRKVDIVVVYKVDRLTRSLADFAKIVEILDACGASFVSVTQQFNTTSSMGRLTLNMLLSFAQFERELTSERIRDKIAASKKRGLWMGGRVPVGYDVVNQKLHPNAREAQHVRLIFQTYLEQGSVARLKAKLDVQGIASKQWTNRQGHACGGAPYHRGALYRLLQNRAYLGEIKHKHAAYPGSHEAIVPNSMWNAVQTQLAHNRQARTGVVRVDKPALLKGILYDSDGIRFTPSHATKQRRRYRYYVNRRALLGSQKAPAGLRGRIPAWEIEALVCERIRSFLRFGKELLTAKLSTSGFEAERERIVRAARELGRSWLARSASEIHTFIRSVIRRVVVSVDGNLEIAVSIPVLCETLLGANGREGAAPSVLTTSESRDETLLLLVISNLIRRRGRVRLVGQPDQEDGKLPDRNVALVAAFARARHWHEMLVSGEASTLKAVARFTKLSERYVRRIIKLAFVSPRVIEHIVRGGHSSDLMLNDFLREFPSDWGEQHAHFGIQS